MAKKKENQEVFYVVMNKQASLENGDVVGVHKTLEDAHLSALEAWAGNDIQDYVVYEVKKLGNLKVIIEK